MRWFLKKKAENTRKFTRIFFATDIHGSEPCFLKFINAAAFYKADTIILGGDITGKQLITIENNHGKWHAHLFGQDWTANTPDELNQLEVKIRSNGYYPVQVTPEERARLEANPSEVEILFTKVINDTVTRWLRLAEQRLRNSAIKCFISPGNDDHFDLDTLLKTSDVVIYPEGQIVDIDGIHSMASCGFANMTPWHCPRDIEEDDLRARLEAMLVNLEDPSRCIFNFHAPPYDSTLDFAQELDANLKPVMIGGQPHLIPVGSRAVREMIEKYQPLVGLHGHIHECRGAVELGKTICINPGSEYSEGILRGVLINIANGRLLSSQFVSA